MIRPVRPDGTIETGGVFVPILRRRLVERIASAAMQRVVLLIAPAGYGKSVALRHFLQTVSEPCVRYDVLPDNATLLGFLRGLAEALGSIAPDARSTLAGAYEKNVDGENPGTDLAMWMHSHMSRFSGLIAIDDLHLAQADREVTRFLSSLIERTRGRVQWIIASRSSQGLPIGTWLAYGESDLAIDEHDLKFTVEEAKEAARAFKLGVRDEELYELLNVTDGWPTAMSFALRSSTRSVDLRSVTTVTREMIYRFLAEQVYATLNPLERDFVETAALLPTLEFDVLVAAGFDQAAVMTQELRERTAFIQEPEPGMFRLHDLFRDFVLHQRELRGEREARAVGIRVGTALERLGRIVPALRLYVENNDAESVMRVLSSQGVDLVAKGYADEVSAALSGPLASTLEKDPAAIGLRGLVELTHGRYHDGERLIARSLRGLASSALKSDLLLHFAAHEVNQGRDAWKVLEEALLDAEMSNTTRLETEAYLAVCHARFGRCDSAQELCARVATRISDADSFDAQARILLRLGTARAIMHHYREATESLMQAASVAAERGLWGVASKAFLNISVTALFGDGDPAQSLKNAHRATEAATRAGDFFDLQNALLAILSLETRAGHAEGAEQVEKQLAELRTNESQRMSYIISSQAHRHAWAGRFGEAQRLFGSVLGRQIHVSDRALNYSMHALYLAMDGQTNSSGKSVESVLAMVDADRSAAEPSGELQDQLAVSFAVVAEVIAGRMTSAQRIFAREKAVGHEVGVAAFAVVEEIVRLGRSASYEPVGIERQLHTMQAAGFGGYAMHLSLALQRVQASPDLGPGDALTPAELKMLRSLASGLAPKDIAVEMERSEQTVRTHIKRLIRKLGCHGRAEAIVAARQMGLLSDQL